MKVLFAVSLLLAAVAAHDGPRRHRIETFNGAFLSWPSKIVYPTCNREFRRAVLKAKKLGKRIRVLGSDNNGHGWGALQQVDDDDIAVVTQRFTKIREIDTQRKTVTVESGCPIHQISEALQKEGLALAGLAGIEDQSVGGCIATATHWSNTKVGNSFSDQLLSARVMDSNGVIHDIDSTSPHFAAVQTNLGVLGMLLDVTLQARDMFYLQKDVEGVPLEQFTADYIRGDIANDTIWGVMYVVTPQMPSPKGVTVTRTSVVTPTEPVPSHDHTTDLNAMKWVRYMTLDMIRHPENIPGHMTGMYNSLSSEASSVGESYDTVALQFYANHRSELLLSTSAEYAVPIDNFQAAWEAFLAVLEPCTDVGLYVTLRLQGPSSSLLAMNAAESGVFVYVDCTYLNKLLDHWTRLKVEEVLIAAGGRPHWGKLNDLKASTVASLYGEAAVTQFKAAKAALDADNLFGNAYTDGLFA